jgi:hypothetical protein
VSLFGIPLIYSAYTISTGQDMSGKEYLAQDIISKQQGGRSNKTRRNAIHKRNKSNKK